MELCPDDVLLVIDVQRDFCPGGRLPVADGNAVVPVINRLAAQFEHVILTQDWHPVGHVSFASSYAGKKPFETSAVDYGEQTLWPDHCVQGTAGADFHPGLEIPHAELILRKGFRREIDSYSAFFENDHRTATGLAGYLRERGLRRVFIAGLAYDYCVRFSAEDAVGQGFRATVIEDACRAIDLNGSVDQSNEAFADLGIDRMQAPALLTHS